MKDINTLISKGMLNFYFNSSYWEKADILKSLTFQISKIYLQLSSWWVPTHTDITNFETSYCNLKTIDPGTYHESLFLCFVFQLLCFKLDPNMLFHMKRRQLCYTLLPLILIFLIPNSWCHPQAISFPLSNKTTKTCD